MLMLKKWVNCSYSWPVNKSWFDLWKFVYFHLAARP